MSHLFYIMGASGVGKDSLINYARNKINGSVRVLFAHRYITRPAQAGNENHIALSSEEFQSRLAGNLFALHWESHGQYYGIGNEINGWLERGFHVVINGSRQYLPEAQRQYAQLKVILIEASPETLKMRLESRGRESAPDIKKRIDRNQEIQLGLPNVIRIHNDGPLEEAGEELLSIISAVKLGQLT